MALIVRDRVLETCSTSGLVDFTLTGAVTGYQRFSAIGNGNTTYYAAYVIGSNDWEVGIGTVGTSSLTRDTILSSSTGSKVNFTGNPVVWCDLPSSKALFTDASGNVTANAYFNGFTSVTASASLITLTVASSPVYLITGSGGQTIKLPDATTLPLGTIFSFNNNQSSGAITVNNNSNTLVASVPSGGFTNVVLLTNSNAAGTWDRHDQTPSNVSWSTNTFDYPGSITSATWNGSTVAYNRGGTGQSSAFVAGGIVYGSSTTALAVTAIGTTGQALLSNGASAPTWGNPTASAGGSTTQVQYNSSGALAGSANMTFDGTSLTLVNPATIEGVKIGKGGGSIASNTSIGNNSMVTTSTGTQNVSVGYYSMNVNTGGGLNSSFGAYSMQSNKTGSNNVSFGTNALAANISGGTNSAIGTGTLSLNTTGSNNTGFGYNTFQYNTTASNLTGLGTQALLNNTTNVATLGTVTGGSGYTNGTYTAVAMTPVSGATFITYPTVTVVVSGGAVSTVTLVTNGVGASSTAATVLTVAASLIGGTGSGFSIPVNTFASGTGNTAVGYQAAYSNTTGINLTAVGYTALNANSTGSNSTAIGNAALAQNTTGSQNTAVGFSALNASQANNNCTVMGYQASLVSNANQLTAVGMRALYATTTGGNNTAFGYYAGYGNSSANANTTGTNNTYIGYQTVGSGVANTNEMVIGYQAIGLGSNTTVIGNTSTTLTQTYGVTKSTNYTVATLPSASTSGVGARAFVTDALAPAFGSTVVTGGAVAVPVYSDGSNWKVG